MSNYQNHLIDPSYFYDCIEEFAFDYDIYIRSKYQTDDHFKIKYTYEKQLIRGSLQSQCLKQSQRKSGNTISNEYNFYCKSLYRINIGDVIAYKNEYLYVDSVNEYDEWGVRSCHLVSVKLSAYRDLEEYIKYLNGDEIV